MPTQLIFLLQLVLGYVACLLCFTAYVLPRLKALNPVEAHRAIATFHSFRFFGLVFMLPGFVGPSLPHAFAADAAYGDFATGVLALLALMTVRARWLFWPLVWAFNLVGLADLAIDTSLAVRLNLPSVAGQLGASYAILMLYVPALFWTHIAAFWLLLRPARASLRASGAPTPLAAAQ